MLNLTFGRQLKAAASILSSMGLMSMVPAALADEPCQSPYMAKIKGEEQFVYVWTLGIEGVGDGSDKLVTVDVRKDSPTFGKVIDTDSVGGRNEA
jgi:selenium-binding protein 1